jgi:hypothetical protein
LDRGLIFSPDGRMLSFSLPSFPSFLALANA